MMRDTLWALLLLALASGPFATSPAMAAICRADGRSLPDLPSQKAACAHMLCERQTRRGLR